MNSVTIWLYISSGLVIGLLSAFAVHNRRVGWKKSRTTLTEALDDFYADLGLSVGPAEQEDIKRMVVSRRVEAKVDPTDFSDQLLRLTTALGEASRAKPTSGSTGDAAKTPERALVPVQTR
jgi:hypothetical protein